MSELLQYFLIDGITGYAIAYFQWLFKTGEEK